MDDDHTLIKSLVPSITSLEYENISALIIHFSWVWMVLIVFSCVQRIPSILILIILVGCPKDKTTSLFSRWQNVQPETEEVLIFVPDETGFYGDGTYVYVQKLLDDYLEYLDEISQREGRLINLLMNFLRTF